MANTTPIFAVASHGKIQSYIDQSILTYPSYVFCKDTNTMVFVDSNLKIQDIKGFNQSSIVVVEELPSENIQSNTFYICNGTGYLLINDILVPVFKDISGEPTDSVNDYDKLNNIPIVNKHGEISSPIILCDLENGSYSISGQYKIGGNLDTIYVPSNNVIFLIDSDNINKYITKLDANVICIYTVNLESMNVVKNEYVTQSWILTQGYATINYVDDAINELNQKIASSILDGIAKVSQLENDVGYLTADDFGGISDESIANLF